MRKWMMAVIVGAFAGLLCMGAGYFLYETETYETYERSKEEP